MTLRGGPAAPAARGTAPSTRAPAVARWLWHARVFATDNEVLVTNTFDSSLFFRASSTPMAILSPDGVIAELNDGWQRLLKDPSAAKGMPFLDLIRASDADRARKVMAGVGREGRAFDARIHPTYGRQSRSVRFDACRDDAGNILLVAAAASSDRDDMLLRLELFETVVESAPVVVWSLDAEGRYTSSDGQGLEALGSAPGEWVGTDALESWKDTPAYANLRRALDGEAYSARLHLAPLSYDVWYLPRRDEDGKPNGMLGFAIDVTAQVRAEDELREKLALIEKQNAALNLLSRTLQSAPLILWGIDRNGVSTHSEGKGLERLGIKPEDTLGTNVFEMYKDNPELLTPITKALAGEEARSLTLLGDVHFEGWYMPVRTPDGEIDGCIGLSIDVTERIKAENELREKLDLIERQSATIRALATPIIQVWDDILCLPVIGTVDSARTADMMQSLLTAIVREQSRYAIVDLTGVEVVDTTTADHLIQLFRAAKVLGVDGVLCGIRPAVAQTVISLGLDLGGVRTMRSLRDALRWCMRNMRDGDAAASNVVGEMRARRHARVRVEER